MMDWAELILMGLLMLACGVAGALLQSVQDEHFEVYRERRAEPCEPLRALRH